MLIIQRAPSGYASGYTVRAKEEGMGRGWVSYAATLEEVNLAITHYYESHDNHGADIDACPFCRHSQTVRQKMAQEAARAARKQRNPKPKGE